MANNLATIARSSYCMDKNIALRAYESYRSGKKIIVDINRLTATCTFFCTRSHVYTCTRQFLCYPKKFRVIIGKNFISVHNTSLVKCRVYNKQYTRTRMVSKGVYENLCIRSKVPKNTVAVNLLIIINCNFIVWTTRCIR